jgi:hypothetical protein
MYSSYYMKFNILNGYRNYFHMQLYSVFVTVSGLVDSVLATGHKVHGFKPSRGQWISTCDKNL